jgi:hypothetical protein
MSINGRSIYVDSWLIGLMTKTLNCTMYAERDHLKKLYNMYCICIAACVYRLVNKGQTPVKSNNVKKRDREMRDTEPDRDRKR